MFDLEPVGMCADGQVRGVVTAFPHQSSPPKARCTPITDLAESGAADETIRDIAGHGSPRMLKHHSHIKGWPGSAVPWNRSSLGRSHCRLPNASEASKVRRSISPISRHRRRYPTLSAA